jgi:hypothetical protein
MGKKAGKLLFLRDLGKKPKKKRKISHRGHRER